MLKQTENLIMNSTVNFLTFPVTMVWKTTQTAEAVETLGARVSNCCGRF